MKTRDTEIRKWIFNAGGKAIRLENEDSKREISNETRKINQKIRKWGFKRKFNHVSGSWKFDSKKEAIRGDKKHFV
jgi:hypothetical protein